MCGLFMAVPHGSGRSFDFPTSYPSNQRLPNLKASILAITGGGGIITKVFQAFESYFRRFDALNAPPPPKKSAVLHADERKQSTN